MTRHSIISVYYNILWTFTQTHSLKIRMATFYAFWFFIISVPVDYPQYPSLLLCECLSRARAPTVSLDMLFRRYASSTLTIWFGLLKLSNNYYALGQSRFYDPTVFLNPSMVKMPLGSIKIRNLTIILRNFSWFYAAKHE